MLVQGLVAREEQLRHYVKIEGKCPDKLRLLPRQLLHGYGSVLPHQLRFPVPTFVARNHLSVIVPSRRSQGSQNGIEYRIRVQLMWQPYKCHLVVLTVVLTVIVLFLVMQIPCPVMTTQPKHL